ncbi:Protein of unknown function [Pyronema omphalodes CBS 100304]|uniref:Uncharacterized protein n=1 Tax=Pyronema omphalodes (strain CBS 100304) TaxID=1076935 RepID=U4KWC5_PYROM|nr:Protein of unknown function [Pyronema omphalodes CBS 100304]
MEPIIFRLISVSNPSMTTLNKNFRRNQRSHLDATITAECTSHKPKPQTWSFTCIS